MTTTETPSQPRFYFVAEVADILRRSEESVRYLIAAKKIKSGRLGGRVIVRPEDLDEFIASAFENAS
ncbi:helix-turn-helix domain-containing protein [Microbacterium azadirachtae]|uniref:helix-turn-helix domain-containing protein n=1 Tax=Microbacterium azadirachtae TaxID=582680 RepID=UPI00088C957D|nr:helix-turn-helix domain-containing protein [Microbacterium azadirachtae]SDL30128.1 DNA binding domain-containing protein, excisionase family [Microbacterium azadirachtae]SEF60213.1 DNA binding domain-containing protein, excisionase family [Microbacterium azadirachtae]SEF60832.1 DNA binding domain-containing protein, excisionase family [Microbacterium azadirachtae]